MFKNRKAQIERQNELITRAESIVNAAESETRELTPDEAAELAEIRDNVRKIKDALDIMDDIDEARSSEGTPAVEASEGARECGASEEKDERAIREERAFENYLRNRVIHERDGELAPANNGKIIPTTIAKRIIELVYDICPILEKSEKYNIGGKLSIPVYPADSSTQISVDYQVEFEEMASSTGNFTTVDLGGFLAGALTKVSMSLINNVNFDIVGFVVKRMAYDIARWVEGELINGTADKVEGLSGATNISTADGTLIITSDEIVKFQGTIKDIYQGNAIWIMSPKTREALRLLKDDVGRYLLNDDITSPFGTTLLGKPVFVSDNCNDIAAGKPVIYYGDMSGLATKFSEEIHIEVLRERFLTQHAVGVIGWFEFDAKVIDNQKIAVFKMADS